MARFNDDIICWLDALTAAVAMQGELLAQIAALLDRGETAPKGELPVAPVKVAAVEADVSVATIPRWCRDFGIGTRAGLVWLVHRASRLGAT
jgi:hypothetical protein